MKTHTPIKLPTSPTLNEALTILALGRMPWEKFQTSVKELSVLQLCNLCAIQMIQPTGRNTLRKLHAACQRSAKNFILPLLTKDA
jgi:hypothetical protein